MGAQTAAFAALNTDIVAISFGTAAWARIWLEETGAPFPVWLDPDQAAYRAFGLEKSLRRAWGPRTLAYYGRVLLGGGRMKGFRGKTDQLGGNFIVDHNGIVRYAYRSHNPTDRPTVEALLEAARQVPGTGIDA